MNIYERVRSAQLKAQEGTQLQVLLTHQGLSDLVYFGILPQESKYGSPMKFCGVPCRFVAEIEESTPGLEKLGNGIFIQRKSKPVESYLLPGAIFQCEPGLDELVVFHESGELGVVDAGPMGTAATLTPEMAKELGVVLIAWADRKTTGGSSHG